MLSSSSSRSQIYRYRSTTRAGPSDPLADYLSEESPFVTKKGGPVSACNWQTAQLNLLSIDFAQDLPVFPGRHATGLLPGNFEFSEDSTYIYGLTRRFGTAWEDISPIGTTAQAYLRRLGDGRHQLVQDEYTSPAQRSSPHPNMPSSPPEMARMFDHNRNDQHTPTRKLFVQSPGSSGRYNTASTPFSATPGSSRTIRGTPLDNSSPLARKGLAHQAPPTTPSPARPLPGSPAGPLTSSSSGASDYLSPPRSKSSPHAIPSLEEDVKDVGNKVFDILSDTLAECGSAGRAFTVTHLAPKAIYLNIDSFKCECKPDHQIILEATDPSQRCKTLFVEYKRREKTISEENVRGQEVAYLLCGLWALYNPESRRRSRSTQSKQLVAYLLSWHHLNCYLTHIVTTTDKLDSMACDLSRSQNQPLQVRRSRKYDMRDPDERVELLGIITSVLLYQMSAHESQKSNVRAILNHHM